MKGLLITYCEITTLIKHNIKTKKGRENQDLQTMDDGCHALNRHQQLVIFGLRTGHCKLCAHLYNKTTLGLTGPCPCGTHEETVEHVLHQYTLYHQQRQGFWYPDASSIVKAMVLETLCRGRRHSSQNAEMVSSHK